MLTSLNVVFRQTKGFHKISSVSKKTLTTQKHWFLYSHNKTTVICLFYVERSRVVIHTTKVTVYVSDVNRFILSMPYVSPMFPCKRQSFCGIVSHFAVSHGQWILIKVHRAMHSHQNTSQLNFAVMFGMRDQGKRGSTKLVSVCSLRWEKNRTTVGMGQNKNKWIFAILKLENIQSVTNK